MSWSCAKFSIQILAVALLAGSGSTAVAADLELTETTRIGRFDDDPDYMFGRIGLVVTTPDGGVIVQDSQMPVLRKYAATGEFVGAVGRDGDGPGEYRDVRGMIRLPDDRIAVLSRPQRVTWFDPISREALGNVRVPSALWAADMLAVDDQGRLMVRRDVGDPGPGDEWRVEWVVVDDEGQEIGTVPIPLEEWSSEGLVVIFPEGARFNFIELTLSAWGPTGVSAIGRNDAYRFEIRRGDTTITVERPWTPIPLKDGEREYWEGRLDRTAQRSQTRFDDLPDHKPPYRALHVDRFGRTWVERYVEAIAVENTTSEGETYTMWHEPNTYDVFGPEGGFLGRAVLPLGMRLAAIEERAVWTVDPTDRGEQLVRWEVGGWASVR